MMLPAHLYVTVEHHEHATVLTPHGVIDTYSVPALHDWIGDAINHGRVRLVLDFSQLEISETEITIDAIEAARKFTALNGGVLALAAAPEYLAKKLRITGMVRVIDLFDTVTDAVAHLAPARAA